MFCNFAEFCGWSCYWLEWSSVNMQHHWVEEFFFSCGLFVRMLAKDYSTESGMVWWSPPHERSGGNVTQKLKFLPDLFWTVLDTRNIACFGNIPRSDPTGVIHQTCYWLDFWGALQKPGVRKALQQQWWLKKVALRRDVLLQAEG